MLLNRQQKHTAKPLWASGRRQRNNKMTMNRNIKLDIKNLTDKITARHSLSSRKYFNFFTHRTKILKFSRHTLHTLASPTSRPVNQSLPKSAIFPTLHSKQIIISNNIETIFKIVVVSFYWKCTNLYLWARNR